jgi:hypothetical protein
MFAQMKCPSQFSFCGNSKSLFCIFKSYIEKMAMGRMFHAFAADIFMHSCFIFQLVSAVFLVVFGLVHAGGGGGHGGG